MYFKKFPKILYTYGYDADENPLTTVATDITNNVRFRKTLFSNITLYDEYDIKDGETPESIAEKIYGNANYHWVVMLTNERYDYISDFPMTQPDLMTYVKNKYGDPQYLEPHHYENERGYVVDSDTPLAVPISNVAFEERVNESKRRIKIITPELLAKVLKQFKDLI